MREVNLRSVDLNLLVILETLLKAKHVTRAAEQLNMSQPAVSRALQRLRDTFADPLLVKTVNGYDLSIRAEQLLPQLETLLQGMQQLIAPPEFDPKVSDQTVRFAGLDLEVALYLPELLEQMRLHAPGMRLDIASTPGDHFKMLEQGEVHFIISGMSPEYSQDQFHRVVVDETYSCCVMGANNPLAKGQFGIDEYLAASHGYVSITGKGPAVMDQMLKQMGLKRKVALRLGSFLTVADYCETTDLIFLLPHRLAQYLSRFRDIAVRPLPEELPFRPIKFYLYWHSRHHQDPMHQWVRELIARRREWNN